MNNLIGEDIVAASTNLAEDFSSVYIGVDVGTGSVRAAFFTETGKLLSSTSRPITVNNPFPDIYQQSSVEIWSAVCGCIAELAQSTRCRFNKALEIGGIGFAATCSLAVFGRDKKGLR